MRILGIDPGSRITGLGVVVASGDRLSALHYESLRLGGGPLPGRLGAIHMRVSELITEFGLEQVAVEEVFMSNNARSALTLGQARGSAISAAVNGGCQVHEYSAREIKLAVVGTGSAAKEQVQHMIRILLGLRESPDSDSADALACAICHIHGASVADRLARAAIQ
jgi:crossover junction endodeoxyribonuclease RuvC